MRAAKRANGAPALCARTNIPAGRPATGGTLDSATATAREGAVAERCRLTAPTLPIDTELMLDDPVRLLLRESLTADLVVMGSRGLGGFLGSQLGSESTAVTAHAVSRRSWYAGAARARIAVVGSGGGRRRRIRWR